MGYTYRSRKRLVRHGQASTYQHHGCRCAACTAANTRHVRAARKSVAIVSAAPAHDHIWMLRKLGMGPQEIANLTGYHVNTIYQISRNRDRMAREDTVRDICALPVPRAVAA